MYVDRRSIDADEIGGTSIGGVGIHELRSKLAIIPQEPVLFSGASPRLHTHNHISVRIAGRLNGWVWVGFASCCDVRVSSRSSWSSCRRVVVSSCRRGRGRHSVSLGLRARSTREDAKRGHCRPKHVAVDDPHM